LRRDVVRRFVAVATSPIDRIAAGGPSAAAERLPAVVVGASELRLLPRRASPDGLHGLLPPSSPLGPKFCGVIHYVIQSTKVESLAFLTRLVLEI